MGGSHKHNVGYEKPDTEEYVLYESIDTKVNNRQDITIAFRDAYWEAHHKKK